MVTNMKCDECAFQSKCVGYNKLKPFTVDARTDLGVELDFISCNDYRSYEDNDVEDDGAEE